MPYPSLEKSQHKKVRLIFEHDWLDIQRGLDDAYYGTGQTFDAEGSPTSRAADGWKHDVSHAWIGFDKAATLALSNALFNRLTAIIWHCNRVIFHEENLKLSADEKIDAKRYDEIYDDSDPPVMIQRKTTLSRDALKTERTADSVELNRVLKEFTDLGYKLNIDGTD